MLGLEQAELLEQGKGLLTDTPVAAEAEVMAVTAVTEGIILPPIQMALVVVAAATAEMAGTENILAAEAAAATAVTEATAGIMEMTTAAEEAEEAMGLLVTAAMEEQMPRKSTVELQLAELVAAWQKYMVVTVAPESVSSLIWHKE